PAARRSPSCWTPMSSCNSRRPRWWPMTCTASTSRSPRRPMSTPQPPSSYLDYLPAIFRQDPFAGQFLLAFETVLSGAGGKPGLETTIGRVADYFDPVTTEADFLPWLAGWVTLSLRADWDEQTQRSFIQQIVRLYRLRGTRAGLLRM